MYVFCIIYIISYICLCSKTADEFGKQYGIIAPSTAAGNNNTATTAANPPEEIPPVFAAEDVESTTIPMDDN